MAKKHVKTESVLVEIPADGHAPEAAFALHIDMRITAKHANALRRIAASLDKSQHVLDSGKRAVHPTDAVRYLIESAAKALEEI